MNECLSFLCTYCPVSWAVLSDGGTWQVTSLTMEYKLKRIKVLICAIIINGSGKCTELCPATIPRIRPEVILCLCTKQHTSLHTKRYLMRKVNTLTLTTDKQEINHVVSFLCCAANQTNLDRTAQKWFVHPLNTTSL